MGQREAHLIDGVASDGGHALAGALLDRVEAQAARGFLQVGESGIRGLCIHARFEKRRQVLTPIERLQHRDAQGHGLGRGVRGHGIRGGAVDRAAGLRPVQQGGQPAAGGRLAMQGAGQVLAHGPGGIPLAFVNGAGLVGEQRGVAELLARGGDPAQRIVVAVVIPIHGRGVQVGFGLARLRGGHALPENAGAAEEFAVGVNVAHSRQDARVSRVGLLLVTGQCDGDFGVTRVECRQRPVERGRSGGEIAPPRIGGGQRARRRSRGLEMREPRLRFGGKLHRGRIGGDRLVELSVGDSGIAGANLRHLGIQAPLRRKAPEEPRAQPRIVKPVLAQQALGRGVVLGLAALVGSDQIVHEDQVFGKAFVRVPVQLAV